MAITTVPVRISYPNVLKPRAMVEGQTPKYSITLMFDKNDKEQMACLRKIYEEAEKVFKEKWPDPKKAPRIPLKGHDKSPIKDGDTACNGQGVPLKEKNPEYEGHYIVRAASSRRPIVVDQGLNEILDEGKIYGGCWCKVNLNAYAYDTQGNKGVTFGLNGVQFWRDDDPFAGAPRSAESMFTPADADDPSAYQKVADPFEEPTQDDEVPF